MMSTELEETCMFFIDDSNIWIEAQKFAASGNSHMPKLKKLKGAKGDALDPRLRIDIGNLINTLRKGRRQGLSFLYGSRPPPNDKVWQAFKKYRFRTKIYDRSAHGREKEVDNSMATDLSSEATELSIRAEYDPRAKKRKDNTIFVAITGDRDLLPAVKKVLQSDIRVELWAWESGIANLYFKLQEQEGLLSVHFLNSIFKEISFTNFSSTRKGGKIDPSKAIVLSDLPPELSLGDLGNQLLQFNHLFYITSSKSQTEAFVEFPGVENIEAMIIRLRDSFPELFKVMSWPEYNNGSKETPIMVDISNMYKLLTGEDDEGDEEEDLAHAASNKEGTVKPPSGREPENANAHRASEEPQNLKDPDDAEGWETVSRSDRNKAHRRDLNKTQTCPQGIRCEKKGQCSYYHPPKEQKLFQEFPDRDFWRWKTKKCRHGAQCYNGSRCPFAHVVAEAWCRRCRIEGRHFEEDCPNYSRR